MLDQPSADVNTDQFAACRIPEADFVDIDLQISRLAFKRKQDCLPLCVKIAVTILDTDFDAVTISVSVMGAVIPGCNDHINPLFHPNKYRNRSYCARYGSLSPMFPNRIQRSFVLSIKQGMENYWK